MTDTTTKIYKLEDEIDSLTSQLRRAQRRLNEFDSILQLTGVKNLDSQISGLQALLDTVMGLPYLTATTALGRAGELERMTDPLASARRKDLGKEIPRHLRPSNFGRSAANREDAEMLWQELNDLADKAISSNLMDFQEWEWLISDDGPCDLHIVIDKVKHNWLVGEFQNELAKQLLESLDGILVPEMFLDRVQESYLDVVEKFADSTRPLPYEYRNQLIAIISSGFVSLHTPWDIRGITEQEWDEMGDYTRYSMMQRGIESDYWQSCCGVLAEFLVDGQRDEYHDYLTYLPNAANRGPVVTLSVDGGRVVATKATSELVTA